MGNLCGGKGTKLQTGRIYFSELAIWRKILLICSLGVSCYIGSMATFEEVIVYSSAPKAPINKTNQIYPVHVMHGSVRYVGVEQRDRFFFWKNRAATLIGVPFLISALVLITSRKK
jgi:hypothetical protein